MLYKNVLSLGGLGLAMLSSSTLLAQAAVDTEETPDSTSEQVGTLPQIYVTATTRDSYADSATMSATKLVLSLRETPQSVSVITQQQMEDWAAVSIRDIISHTTGVYSSTSGSQDRPSYNVRGGSVNLIRVDGVQQFPGGRRPDVSGDSIAYERVEILRGANGLMTGVGDPTASINMVRKRATAREFTGQAGVSSGTWDYGRAELDISTPLSRDGDVRARVAAAHSERDSFIDRYGQRKSAFYGTVEADLSDNTLIRAGVEIADTVSRGSMNTHAAQYYFSDGSLVNPSRGLTGMSAKWSGWPLNEETYFAGIDHAFNNGWHFSAITTYNTIEMQGGDLFFIFPYDYMEPDGSSTAGFDYSAVIASSQDKQKTWDVTLQGPFELFGLEHEFVVGYNDFRRSRTTYGFEADQSVISLDGLNGLTWDGDVPHYPFRDLGRSSENITNSGGFFAAARLTLADSLKMIVGARITDWETYTDAYNADSGSYLRTTGEYDIEGELTPYVGLVYDLNDVISLYGSYTDAFQPQNRYDANDNLLDPVTGKSYEIGAKGEFFDGGLNVSFAYYENEKDNVAILDESFPPNYTTPEGNTPFVSSGKGTTAKGYEMEISGEISRGWNMYGGISYTKTRDGSGEQINTEIPTTLFNIYTTYRLPDAWDKWTLGLGANWQDSYYVDSVRPTGEPRGADGYFPTAPIRREQDAVTLVNLMLRYELSNSLTLSLNASNLLDEEYFGNILAYDGSVTWGDPRSLRMTARYDW